MDKTESSSLARDPRLYGATLRAIVEACPLAMVALDREGIVRIWSPGAEQMFGWTEAEVVGHPLPIAPEILAAQLPLSSGKGIELIWPQKHGEPLHISLTMAPLHNGRGDTEGRVLFIADITSHRESEQERLELMEREQAALAQAKAERRFRELLETAPDAILEIDSQGRIVLLNAV